MEVYGLEEKKAIERIDYIQDFIIENGQYNADVNDMEYFSKILNLIEKQSKEIEELKQNIHLKEVYVLKTNDYIKGTNVEDELCNKKWEDKIKAKTIEIKNRPAKDEFITASQGKLNTIIDMESLLEKE